MRVQYARKSIQTMHFRNSDCKGSRFVENNGMTHGRNGCIRRRAGICGSECLLRQKHPDAVARDGVSDGPGPRKPDAMRDSIVNPKAAGDAGRF